MSPQVLVVVILAVVVAILLAAAWVYYRWFPIHKIYKSKVHLQHAFDSISDPLAVVDTAYTLLRVNRAYTELVGKGFPAVLGRRCYVVLRNRTVPCADCRLREAVDERSHTFVPHSEHPFQEKGTAISLTFFPSRSVGTKTAPSAVEHIRDITETERLKNILEQKNRLLEKAVEDYQAAQKALHEEIDMARHVQRGILPRELPRFDGLRIAVAYHPIAAVGGDIYDFIPFSDSKLGIFIGDASGHGLHAAFVSTISKMSLYQHTQNEIAPEELFSRMNQDLIENIHTGHYLTCFWAVFDSANNSLSFVRAGHPKPFVLRPDNQTVALQASGTFLGIIEQATFQSKRFQCQKGDRIYLYTDGVYVVTVRDGKKRPALNNERFQQIVESCNHMAFDQVIPAIQAELSKFTCDDDYTLMVLEVTNQCPQPEQQLFDSE